MNLAYTIKLSVLSVVLNLSGITSFAQERKPPRKTEPAKTLKIKKIEAKPRQTMDFANTPQPELSVNGFKLITGLKFKDKFAGYQVLIVKDGKMVAELADGYSRLTTEAITGIPMTTSTNANIGSVSKTLTGFLLMAIAEQRAAATNRTVDAVLSDKIVSYMPAIWANATNNYTKTRTLRDMIQHRTHFTTNSDFPLTSIKSGAASSNCTRSDKRCYQNVNYAMMGYLIPIINNPSLKATINAKYKTDADDENMRIELGQRFNTLMKSKLTDKAPGKPYIHCNPNKANHTETNAVNYPSPPSTNAQHFDDWERLGGFCHGAGGLYASARDLGSIVATLQHTNNIMSKQTYRSLYKFNGTATERADRLVFASQRTNAKLKEFFGTDNYTFHNGSHTFNGRRAVALLIKLPGGYHAVMIANSDINSSNAAEMGTNTTFWMADQLVDGFTKALKYP